MGVFGLELAPLPPGYVPLEAECVIKCLDADGDTVVVTRGTKTQKIWDSIGLLSIALDQTRAQAIRTYDED